MLLFAGFSPKPFLRKTFSSMAKYQAGLSSAVPQQSTVHIGTALHSIYSSFKGSPMGVKNLEAVGYLLRFFFSNSEFSLNNWLFPFCYWISYCKTGLNSIEGIQRSYSKCCKIINRHTCCQNQPLLYTGTCEKWAPLLYVIFFLRMIKPVGSFCRVLTGILLDSNNSKMTLLIRNWIKQVSERNDSNLNLLNISALVFTSHLVSQGVKKIVADF